MKKFVAASVAVLSVALLTGCSEQQELRDLENVSVTEPEKSRLVVNVNGYPNLVLLCVEGVGYVTTTREDRPVVESPLLTEGWCRS